MHCVRNKKWWREDGGREEMGKALIDAAVVIEYCM